MGKKRLQIQSLPRERLRPVATLPPSPLRQGGGGAGHPPRPGVRGVGELAQGVNVLLSL